MNKVDPIKNTPNSYPSTENFISSESAKPGERCNEFAPGTKDCQEGYRCQLENKMIPDLGGICVKN